MKAQNEQVRCKSVASKQDVIARYPELGDEFEFRCRWHVWNYELFKLLLTRQASLLAHFGEVAGR